MRKKYADCRRADGDCTICPLANYGLDCHNRFISKLEYEVTRALVAARIEQNLTQAQLAEASGVNIRQIQRVELGEAEAGNLTAKNLIAIADALHVDIRRLI
mgnify:CR=1 FL=1